MLPNQGDKMKSKPTDTDKPEYLDIPPFYPTKDKGIKSKQVNQTEVIEPSYESKLICYTYAKEEKSHRLLRLFGF